MKRAIGCSLLAVCLTFATGASANSFKLKGSLVGNPTAKVTVKVKKNGSGIVAVKGMKFTNVPATCSDGSGGVIGGSINPFPVDKNNFNRKGRISGAGITNGFLKVGGHFSRGGKAISGKVRFSFKIDSGAGCGTDDLRWKAQK